MSDELKARARALADEWADECVTEEASVAIRAALRAERQRVWEKAASIAEAHFPYAATENERYILGRCLEIAEKCRQQAQEEDV